jgi:AraC-like DNA-binding protein
MKAIKERIYHLDQSLLCRRFTLPAFAMERHRHPQFELTWIERGVGIRFVGDSAAPFAEGDLVLIGSEVPHTWVSSVAADSGSSRKDDSCIASVVQFSATLFDHAALPELAALQPLLQRASRGLLVCGPAHAEVTQRMTKMIAQDGLGQLENLLGILGVLHRAPSELKAIASPVTEPARAVGPNRRIDRVIQWINQNLTEPLNPQDAALVAHVSPAAFSRFFKRETGKTYTDYVNDVRCAKACVLLRQTAHTIAHIANDCGFSTHSHFNRQFISRLGLTPRQYRSAMRP